MQFDFSTSNQILFGPGRFTEAGAKAASLGRRPLVTCGMDAGRNALIEGVLREAGLRPVLYPIPGEPTVDVAMQGVALARQESCDLLVGFGGGSAVDSAKAIAALVTNPGEPLDYLEVVGKGKPLVEIPLPVIAIPTTAGTGSEVTRNAVLGVPDQHVKVSLRSPQMLPRVAIVDPELTYSLPPEVTASTGLDALTQVIEPYVSNAANPLTDTICREAIARGAGALRRAYIDGQDQQARLDMSLVSLFGGLALANARLGAVHGFAGPVGGMFPAAHGAVCAAFLPHVMRINIQALRDRDPGSGALKRYTEIAQLLTGNPEAAPEDGAAWIQELCRDLHVLPLSAYGVSPADFDTLVEKASGASSMKGNPIRLNNEELLTILSLAV